MSGPEFDDDSMQCACLAWDEFFVKVKKTGLQFPPSRTDDLRLGWCGQVVRISEMDQHVKVYPDCAENEAWRLKRGD